MSRLVLTREPSTEQGTFGQLQLPPDLTGRAFRTGELPWLDNRPMVSCIPPGLYICRWHNSPSKGRCYQITNVPGRTDVLFHNGNFCGEKSLGWSSDSDACILLGLTKGILRNREGLNQDAVCGSNKAREDFERILGQQDFELEIVAALAAL